MVPQERSGLVCTRTTTMVAALLTAADRGDDVVMPGFPTSSLGAVLSLSPQKRRLPVDAFAGSPRPATRARLESQQQEEAGASLFGSLPALKTAWSQLLSSPIKAPASSTPLAAHPPIVPLLDLSAVAAAQDAAPELFPGLSIRTPRPRVVERRPMSDRPDGSCVTPKVCSARATTPRGLEEEPCTPRACGIRDTTFCCPSAPRKPRQQALMSLSPPLSPDWAHPLGMDLLAVSAHDLLGCASISASAAPLPCHRQLSPGTLASLQQLAALPAAPHATLLAGSPSRQRSARGSSAFQTASASASRSPRSTAVRSPLSHGRWMFSPRQRRQDLVSEQAFSAAEHAGGSRSAPAAPVLATIQELHITPLASGLPLLEDGPNDTPLCQPVPAAVAAVTHVPVAVPALFMPEPCHVPAAAAAACDAAPVLDCLLQLDEPAAVKPPFIPSTPLKPKCRSKGMVLSPVVDRLPSRGLELLLCAAELTSGADC